MRFIIGFAVVIGGFLMVWKADWFVKNFGQIGWAEEHLSTEGGTRIFYKILGIIFIMGAFMGMTGLLGDIVGGIFGPLFKFGGKTVQE